MKKYTITARETILHYYTVEVPDDCDDPAGYFYEMEPHEQEARLADTEYTNWEIIKYDEIKEDA